MLENIHKKTELAGAFITGFLFSLIIFLFKDISKNFLYIFSSIILIFIAIYLAKKTAHHFHGEHTHVGDSTLDIVAALILFLVNIFHPAVDGFSFYQLFIRDGIFAGIVFAFGILIHEMVRQSVFVTVFKNMGIKWYMVVSTAFFGIVLGIITGFLSSNFLEQYEWFIDLVTLFAYSFIVSEFYFSGHFVNKKTNIWLLILGMIVGVMVSFLD